MAPLCDTFFGLFDFIACIFNILDDRILIFFLLVTKVISYDHIKNKVFTLSLKGSKNPLSFPNKVNSLRHLAPLRDTKHQSATPRIYRLFIYRTIDSLFSRLKTDPRRKRRGLKKKSRSCCESFLWSGIFD